MKKNNEKPVIKSDDQDKKISRARTSKTDNVIITPLNDGMNTPVPDSTVIHIPSETEKALLKQAENPLGDPNKK